MALEHSINSLSDTIQQLTETLEQIVLGQMKMDMAEVMGRVRQAEVREQAQPAPESAATPVEQPAARTAPTRDELIMVATAYAEKHGGPTTKAVLDKFCEVNSLPTGGKLSDVPEELRANLMALYKD